MLLRLAPIVTIVSLIQGRLIMMMTHGVMIIRARDDCRVVHALVLAATGKHAHRGKALQGHGACQ